MQMRRFLAAVAILPAPPELPGRRWEKPARWLESLRLQRCASSIPLLGTGKGSFHRLGGVMQASSRPAVSVEAP
jgi:hypothetical protein